MPRWKPLAYAQLMRLPNVFTAVADPLAGWLVIGGSQPVWHLPALVATSACLYTSGIVFNDCFDFELDRRQRPERPLPSGAVSRPAAWILASALMIAGLGLSMSVGAVAFGIAVFLAFMILFYNAWAKRFVVLGPLTLGACRFANFLLGMRAMPPKLWVMPVLLGAYAAAIAFLARGEAGEPRRQRWVASLLPGIIALDAAFVLVVGDWGGALLVLSLLIPVVALRRRLPMT